MMVVFYQENCSWHIYGILLSVNYEHALIRVIHTPGPQSLVNLIARITDAVRHLIFHINFSYRYWLSGTFSIYVWYISTYQMCSNVMETMKCNKLKLKLYRTFGYRQTLPLSLRKYYPQHQTGFPQASTPSNADMPIPWIKQLLWDNGDMYMWRFIDHFVYFVVYWVTYLLMAWF